MLAETALSLDTLHAILGLAAILLPILAGWLRGRGKTELADKADLAEKMLAAVIGGVEKGDSSATKRAIATEAEKLGVAKPLDAAVQAKTAEPKA